MGVFEHEEMKYPWFAPKMQVFESGAVQDMCGEDVDSFCLDAIEAGFEILVRSSYQSRSRGRQGLSDQHGQVYHTRQGEVLWEDLSQLEYFEKMEDLVIEYYQTGSPSLPIFETKTIGD